MSAAEPNGTPDPAAEAIVRGVSEVISAALGVGASMAKVVAQATAGSNGVPPVQDDRPLEAIVHYGVAAVTNMVGMVVAGAGLGARGAAAGPASGASARGASAAGANASSTSALPTVRAGHSLRVPLSVENPGGERMSVTPACVALSASAPGAGEPLDVRAVRFQPATLEIAPRDFEKLTVFVDTTPNTPPGRYEAVISLGTPGAETRLRFEVAGAS